MTCAAPLHAHVDVVDEQVLVVGLGGLGGHGRELDEARLLRIATRVDERRQKEVHYHVDEEKRVQGGHRRQLVQMRRAHDVHVERQSICSFCLFVLLGFCNQNERRLH